MNGAVVDDFAFFVLGAAVFPGSRVGSGSIVRTNAVVHINSERPPNRVVPESWKAIGSPATIVPRGSEERRLFSMHGLNFTKTIFGEDLSEVGLNYLGLFDTHRSDRDVTR